jgi:hypothetical protein
LFSVLGFMYDRDRKKSCLTDFKWRIEYGYRS